MSNAEATHSKLDQVASPAPTSEYSNRHCEALDHCIPADRQSDVHRRMVDSRTEHPDLVP
jgi:hypothetical protein